jgi:hypothetical protein
MKELRPVGFAVVEVLLIFVVFAIVGALVFMAVFPADRVSHATACTAEANAFRQTVQTYKTGPVTKDHAKNALPPDHPVNSDTSLLFVGISLGLPPIKYADGSMHQPVTKTHGWKYNFTNGSVDASDCTRA